MAEKEEAQPNDHGAKIHPHIEGLVCVRPTYVFGSFVAVPPNYLVLGRGASYNSSAGSSGGAGSSSPEEHQSNEHKSRRKHKTSSKDDDDKCDAHGPDHKLHHRDRNSPERRDGHKHHNHPNKPGAHSDDHKKVKNCEPREAPWMHTIDGRAYDDPGFKSFSQK